MNERTALWVIVLAAGQGSRLHSLTTGNDGAAVPKQFCSLRGGRSLLLDAISRARRLTARNRVVVVVASEHERWWRDQLRMIDADNIVVQPQNRGTGVGLLLPLRHVLARAPEAVCCVMPSDHWVDRPDVLLQAMWGAVEAIAAGNRALHLFGITPDAADTEYGWIVPGGRLGAARAVAQFVEKPALQRAAELWAAGAVWNSFLLAGHARSLWDLAARHLPAAAAAIEAAFALPVSARRSALASAYTALPDLDFSRVVLERAVADLRLVAVAECGWTDLGSPRRVAECIGRLERRAHGQPPRAAWFPTVDLAQRLRSGRSAGVALA